MPARHRLEAGPAWVELTVSDQDWAEASPVLLTTWFRQLSLIRAFEEYVLQLAGQGLVHGPAHSSIGQEGGAVGSIAGVLRSDDTVNGSHRGHHQFLAKALSHVSVPGEDIVGQPSTAVRSVLTSTLAEIAGLARGYCRGRGGSMHLRWREAGAMGTNAIVGGGVPQAAGFAWAHRHSGTDAVSVSYFGDGAINIGSTLETLNLAAAWRLPVCFFVENNRYAVSTSVDEVTAEPRLSARAPGFGVPSWRVDGMNVLAVHHAMSEAVAHMRVGGGPTMVEAEVYRYFHQNGPFPGSAFGYRSKDEEAEWRARDPITQLADRLVHRRIFKRAEVERIRADAAALITSIGNELFEPDPGGKTGQRRVKPPEWPDSDFVDVGVRSDLSELEGARYAEESSFGGRLEDRKFVDVIADVMARRMALDKSIVVMGEDIHRLRGGTNGATRDLSDKYPTRTLGTPISENAFVGLAGGLAIDGRYRPVVEFMYADFVWVAADQVFNQIGKLRHMFGGDGSVPLVLRTKVAMGTGYGSQHSMDPAGIFATSPGWRIAAPSTPFDYVGMMNSALRCEDPILVIEHVDLYGKVAPAPVDDLDFVIPIGTAAIRRIGASCTIISYLAMVSVCLEAAEQLDSDAEVIDLRWLDRASVDWDTLGTSIRKTNRVLIVEQGAAGTSYGGWLADEIQRRYFDWLDAPIQRMTGKTASPSISKVLERAAITGLDDVVAALKGIGEA